MEKWRIVECRIVELENWKIVEFKNYRIVEL